MSTERNKILEILQEDIKSTGDYDGGHYVEGREIAAKNIEALVLQSQIDLLKELQFYSYTIEIEGGGNEVISPSSVESKISELSNQLKELSKTD